MFFLLLIALLVYTNATLARKKGLNPTLWGVISVFGFFAAYLLLGGIYISAVYKGPYTSDAVKAWAFNSPLEVLMMFMLGIGGMLVVRFILEKKSEM